MKTFLVTFSCRRVGAIGVSYHVDFGPIVADDEKEAEELARWLAYETHEHLHLYHVLTLRRLTPDSRIGWYDRGNRRFGDYTPQAPHCNDLPAWVPPRYL